MNADDSQTKRRGSAPRGLNLGKSLPCRAFSVSWNKSGPGHNAPSCAILSEEGAWQVGMQLGGSLLAPEA